MQLHYVSLCIQLNMCDRVRTEKKTSFAEMFLIVSRGIHYPRYHCTCFLNVSKTSVYVTIVKVLNFLLCSFHVL